MIGQYLPNNNENATVTILPKILHLNQPLVSANENATVTILPKILHLNQPLVSAMVYAVIKPAVGNIAVGCLCEVAIPIQIGRWILAHRRARHATAGAEVEVVLAASTAATPQNISGKPCNSTI
jgi:hypothetical protein